MGWRWVDSRVGRAAGDGDGSNEHDDGDGADWSHDKVPALDPGDGGHEPGQLDPAWPGRASVRMIHPLRMMLLHPGLAIT
jgi:hypothetical protein